jgi:hypothetical protein
MVPASRQPRRHLANSPFQRDPLPEVETYAVGDRVSHVRHGLGVVIATTAHTVTVRFASANVRVESPYTKLTRL